VSFWIHHAAELLDRRQRREPKMESSFMAQSNNEIFLDLRTEGDMHVANIRAHQNKHTVHTTLRELIATISDIAFEYAAGKEEAYEIARLVLVRMLKAHPPGVKSLTGGFPRVNTCISLFNLNGSNR